MSQIAIGVDENTALHYEGSPTLYGHAIWPTPFLSIASHIGTFANWTRSTHVSNLQNAEMVFREDFFDPVARIRRGRLYTRSTAANPATWHVQRHPAYSARGQSNMSGPNTIVGQDANGFIQTRLITFVSWTASESFFANRRNAVLILGFADRVASHTILDVERLANGEELITVRTRASLGILPELIESAIPEAFSALALEQYEKAANAAFRDDAESVVDRCREAAAAALIAERSQFVEPNSTNLGKDLGDLANFFTTPQFGEKGGRVILSNSARIIARMHARSKSSERVNKGHGALTEGDAECALSLLGTIYRELGWTR